MRLINTSTKTLEVFEPSETPPYATLSHTWTKNELCIEDLESARQKRTGARFIKLDESCRVAKAAGYQYLWLDTCCIDKTNNVELSEAINSMYRWYSGAKVCYAYLEDASAETDRCGSVPSLKHCKWFTRGWTLQELLAPSEVIFLDSDWTTIGTKTSLAMTLTEITGIPTAFLLGRDLRYASVAMRMSWAARRKTTKAEDIAYCLLGIFDIQMPLLYGEGHQRAFERLQEQIMKISDDQSIFAWTGTSDEFYGGGCISLLAPNPSAFESSGNMIEAEPQVIPGYLQGIRTPTVFTNKGLHLSLPIISKEGRVALAILNCSQSERQGQEHTAIWLEDVSTNGGRYVRKECQTLQKVHLRDIHKSARYANITAARNADIWDLWHAARGQHNYQESRRAWVWPWKSRSKPIVLNYLSPADHTPIESLYLSARYAWLQLLRSIWWTVSLLFALPGLMYATILSSPRQVAIAVLGPSHSSHAPPAASPEENSKKRHTNKRNGKAKKKQKYRGKISPEAYRTY